MKSLLAVVALMVGANDARAAEITPKPSDSPPRGSAESRVQVTLMSDGETWVSITNVHAPSKFQTKNVRLPPGDYEVMGRRKGYRDVRRSLHVSSGTAPKPLMVVCTESVLGSP
jgi:hypothetical protein